MFKKPMIAASVALASVLLLSACGTGSSTSPSATSKPAVSLPATLESSGTLTVSTTPAVEPISFTKNGKIVGFDIDLITAIGKKLGLKVKITQQQFPGSVTSVISGRYDVVAVGLTDTTDRQQVLDFADYLRSYPVLLAPKGNPLKLKNTASLCGHKAALVKGTAYDTTVGSTLNTTTCASNHVTIQEFPDLSTAFLAVSSGRADFAFDDSNLAPVAVANNKSLQIVRGTFGITTHYGFASKKGNGVAEAIQAGLKLVIKDGEYKKIAAKWDQSANLYTEATINHAG